MSSLLSALHETAKTHGATYGRESREPELAANEVKLGVVAMASLAIIALFTWLLLFAPGVSVTRSDQTRAALTVETPVETIAAFEVLGAIEQCAATTGQHDLLGTQWPMHATRGVSFVTYTVTRDGCGSASLVIPVFGASDEYRIAARTLIDRMITAGSAMASREPLRANADQTAREARAFHALAREMGVGYRLITWQPK